MIMIMMKVIMKVIKMVTMMFIKTTRILKILVETIATMMKMTNM